MRKDLIKFVSIVMLALSTLLTTQCLGQTVDSTDSPKDLLEMDLEDLLDISVVSGQEGGFGKQLEELKLKPYMHGYAAIWYRSYDLNRRKTTSSFSLQYFNPIFGLSIKDKITAEIMLEYEHGGNEVGMRYGIIDYSPYSFLTIRAGKFLMPLGKFNQYYYPEYINLLNDRPISHWRIIPSVWSEVGAQLMGNFALSKKLGFNYSIFIVNGLEQGDGAYGGDIRGMRDNFRDYKDSQKSYGGRLGIVLDDKIELGASYYTGAYSTDGNKYLTILCMDAGYHSNKFIIRGEYVYGIQDTATGKINKHGGFLETAYRLNLYFEPVLRYDQADLPEVNGFDNILNTETIQRITCGLIIYPEPKDIARFTFKFNYSTILNDGTGGMRNEFLVQTAIGF